MDLSKYTTVFDSQHKSSTELVTDALRQAVIDGALAANQNLKQAELARQFGVSRIPVKEAFVRLESEGFIVMHANAVAKVAALSHDEVIELYDIRLVLESLALKEAIPKMLSHQFGSIESILKQADRTDDSVLLGQYNQAFHLSIYQAAKRPRLLGMIKQIHLHVDRYLRVAYSLLPYRRPSSEEHWAIFEACQENDVAKALTLLEQHLNSVKSQISEYLFHLKT